jgi:hypothetical protein
MLQPEISLTKGEVCFLVAYRFLGYFLEQDFHVSWGYFIYLRFKQPPPGMGNWPTAAMIAAAKQRPMQKAPPAAAVVKYKAFPAQAKPAAAPVAEAAPAKAAPAKAAPAKAAPAKAAPAKAAEAAGLTLAKAATGKAAHMEKAPPPLLPKFLGL